MTAENYTALDTQSVNEKVEKKETKKQTNSWAKRMLFFTEIS